MVTINADTTYLSSVKLSRMAIYVEILLVPPIHKPANVAMLCRLRKTGSERRMGDVVDLYAHLESKSKGGLGKPN